MGYKKLKERKIYEFKESHYRHETSGVCPKCNKKGDLTTDIFGNIMCSKCFKDSL